MSQADVDPARAGARRVLGGRYELLSPLGAGGMSEVWRARDTTLGRDVAVKLLPSVAAQDPSSRRRIEREAQALAALSHPNVVAVFDSGEDSSVPYIVMELVDGTDLHRYLAERGPLPVEEATTIMQGILAGVERAHVSGVVHGDLKPANVFIGPHGPKVGDFGVARILEHETGTTTVAATPTFAAPEVLKGERPSAQSDVYSAACMLYEMLAGRAPFVGANGWDVAQQHLSEPVPRIAKVRPDVRSTIDAAIRRGMAKDPNRRFGSAAAFGEALAGLAPNADGATVAIAKPPVPTASPSTEVLGEQRPQRDPAKVAVFGPFAGWGGRGLDQIRRHPLVIAVIAGLLILLAALLMHDPGPKRVAVPDVRGKKSAIAASYLRLKGFKVDVAYRVITSGPVDKVIDELPSAGEKVAPGAEIHLFAGAYASTPAPTVAPKAPTAKEPATATRPRGKKHHGKD